jgi:hypothetical protein
MPKSIYLTDEQWSQVAAHAVACGFFVGRGPKSELAKFVVFAAEQAHNLSCSRPATQQSAAATSKVTNQSPTPASKNAGG